VVPNTEAPAPKATEAIPIVNEQPSEKPVATDDKGEKKEENVAAVADT
jgi:hypothetical protein